MTLPSESKEYRLRQTDRMLRRGKSHEEIATSLGVHKRTIADYAAQLRDSPLPEENDIYSLVIYQNPEYVSALLQQLFSIGLPVEEFAEMVNSDLRKRTNDAGISGSASAGLSIPFLPSKADVRLSGDVKRGSGEEDKTEQKHHQKFQFTQANFLHNVRQALHDRGLIQVVTGDGASIKRVTPGTFVQFSASFQPNEVNNILDLATPDLVAAIVKHQHRKEALKVFNFQSTHDERQAQATKLQIEADSKGELAAAATVALRQDFRNETTREYFGRIVAEGDGEDVTAITICDTEYFLNQDKDRILDGTFKVVGKVTQVSFEELSILSRNKFLSRLQQPVIDELTEKLEAATEEGQFNATLKLGIQPPIMKVIPIAIYL